MPKPAELPSKGVVPSGETEEEKRKKIENMEYREAFFGLLIRIMNETAEQSFGKTMTIPGIIPKSLPTPEPVPESLSIGGFIFDGETIHPLAFFPDSKVYALGGEGLKCLYPAQLLTDSKWRPLKSRLHYMFNKGVEVQWGDKSIKQYWMADLSSPFLSSSFHYVNYAFEVFNKPPEKRNHVVFLSREFQNLRKGTFDKEAEEKFRQECDKKIGNCYRQILEGLIKAGGFENREMPS